MQTVEGPHPLTLTTTLKGACLMKAKPDSTPTPSGHQGKQVSPHNWRVCQCMACVYARTWWVA